MTASPGRNNVTLMWARPTQPNSVNVSYTYTISVMETGDSVLTGNTTTLSAFAMNLLAFTNYSFSVTAMNNVGSSATVMGSFMTFEGCMLCYA